MIKKSCDLIDWFNGKCLAIGSFFTLTLVFLTTQQVIARYLFGASSIAIQELQWHLFGAIFLLGTAYTLKSDEHVRVDIFYTKLSQNKQNIVNLLGIGFFLIPSMIVLIWVGIEFFLQALDYQNPRTPDHYSAMWFSKDGMFFHIIAPIEGIIRSNILVGEISPDPGGLEARWIIKSFIPLSGLLVLLQGISEILKILLSKKQGEG